ncbi:chemosensory receptor c [Plakobranchus ocellatus]|uniref:Chemosensory receptor c n=1 Tax=Plakobranchus ocellatus TaxID=259542 RepID=A0AAV4ARM2_9GAST|nr:chemosensory receptor c [Plakobranchus ocellatus]
MERMTNGPLLVGSEIVGNTPGDIVTFQNSITTLVTANVSSGDHAPETHIKPLIPKSMMVYIDIYAHIVVPFVVSSFGVVSNIINLIIFTRLGLKDGMSVGLWSLSFSDFTVTAQTLGSSLCSLCGLLLPKDTRIPPGLVHYVSLLWSQDMMYLVSNWITTFISLERCVCVIRPFKVKEIFTRSRSIAVIIIIFLAHVISYAPIFATHRLEFQRLTTESKVFQNATLTTSESINFSSTAPTSLGLKINASDDLMDLSEPSSSTPDSFLTHPSASQSSNKRFTMAPSSSAINHTPSLREDTTLESWKEQSRDDFDNDVDEEVQEIMVVGFSENRAVIHHTVDIINGAVLPVLQQALVIASAGGLAYGLKSASKVRTKGHAQNADSEKTTGSRDSANAKQPQKSALSQKEIRLVKVVSVLALILTICNIPRFVAVYTTLLIPEMHIGEAYENTYVFLWALTALFASVNASVNIFVYLRVNAAYRAGFKSLFSCCFKDK